MALLPSAQPLLRERKRRVFRALLPVAMFELFVDIGNTELELRDPRYDRRLVAQFASLPVRVRVPSRHFELHNHLIIRVSILRFAIRLLF